MIQERYKALCNEPSDIHEHLPTLKKYAKNKEVVEMGVRAIVSTWALLAGKPKVLLSIDIKHPREYGGDLYAVMKACEEEQIPFGFLLEDSLKVDSPPCDVLFIDTLHTYEQLSQELKLHHAKVKEHIIMHDTNPEEFPEMQKAIKDFLEENKEWKIEKEYTNCHGLTCLVRV